MLVNQIKEDLTKSLKLGDSKRVATLRFLLSAIKNKEIDLKRELTDDEAVTILMSQKKQRQDSIEAYQKGGRPELANKEKTEIVLIEQYLPKAKSEDEIIKIVKETISETGATPAQFGQVMGLVMKKIGPSASGNQVAEIVKKELK